MGEKSCSCLMRTSHFSLKGIFRLFISLFYVSSFQAALVLSIILQRVSCTCFAQTKSLEGKLQSSGVCRRVPRSYLSALCQGLEMSIGTKRR